MATRLLALGMNITYLQRFLGHESIATTRLYAETTAATLQRRFDQLTDPAAHWRQRFIEWGISIVQRIRPHRLPAH